MEEIKNDFPNNELEIINVFPNIEFEIINDYVYKVTTFETYQERLFKGYKEKLQCKFEKTKTDNNINVKGIVYKIDYLENILPIETAVICFINEDKQGFELIPKEGVIEFDLNLQSLEIKKLAFELKENFLIENTIYFNEKGEDLTNG